MPLLVGNTIEHHSHGLLDRAELRVRCKTKESVRVCRCRGERPASAAFWLFPERNIAHNHRLMSPCLVPVCSAAHQLVKTCPSSGPIGDDPAWTGSDVWGSCLCKVYRVTTNIIHTPTSLLCQCRQGVPAAPLRRDVSAAKQIIKADQSAPDFI